MQQHIEKWQHLSREEQKILAEVWGLVQNDDQEVHYEMLKLNAPLMKSAVNFGSEWQKHSAPCRPIVPSTLE